MKNTMKKLLSLVLVAMLLVCAVPFQAAATEAAETLTVKTYVDGKYITDKSVPVKPGESLTLTKELAESLVDSDKEFVEWTGSSDNKATGVTITYDALKDANAKGGYFVNLYVNKKVVEDTRVDAKVPVEIYVDGSYVRKGEITVPVDGSVKLTKALALTLVNSDKEFVKWTGASDNEATDYPIQYGSITDGYYLKLYVKTQKAEETAEDITLKIIDDKGKVIAGEFQITPVNGKSSVIGDILTYRWAGTWKDSYEFVTAKSDAKGGNLTLSTVINAGDTLTVTLKTKSTNSNNNTNNGTTNKFPWKVYLHIYKDTKVSAPDKTINISDGIALDGTVSLAEVKTVVKNYYTAKTSDGINYDGLYMAEGNFAGNYVTDSGKKDTIENINELRKDREVHIIVMITNANAKSSEKADTTNPKTGDMIMVPVIFMLVSGAAIAGVYFYNKKRSVR